MAFYHDPGEPDHAGAVVTVGIETCGHPAQHRPGNQTCKGRSQRSPELLAHAVTDEAGSAFHRLESYVAREPVGDDNVDFARKNIIALHEPNVVEARGLQER